MPPVDAPGGRSAVLTVSEVAVRFGGVAALSDVSLLVQPGTVTGLIGPNGAGKTTLFNVISGLQVPDRGSVHLFDTDVTSMKPHRRARLGLARTFQRLELFGTLTASENVQVGLESDATMWDRPRLRRMVPGRRGASSRRGDDVGALSAAAPGSPAAVAAPGSPAAVAAPGSPATACDRLLAVVGLDRYGSRQSSSMPTGMARMVELARALAIGPKLLLLDEPGSGLDEAESAALGDLLTRLAASGMAVLLVEHDMELVMGICDHIYVLDFGDIIASGTPEQVRSDALVQAAYLGEAATAEADPVVGTRVGTDPLAAPHVDRAR
jgi:branched-chain amino acid transport system ATP-binding protein